MFMLLRLLVISVIFQYCSADLPDHTIDIQLAGNWKKTPFALNLIESASNENESYFLPAVSIILGVSLPSGDNDDFDETELSLEDISELSDEQAYLNVFKLLKNDFERASFNVSLSSRLFSPRIQAQYSHYTQTAQSSARTACGSDSSSWAVLNGEFYCHPDDVFALKTTGSSSMELLPFDRVVGDKNKPTVELYGDYRSASFKQFFLNLYISARAGKISFVWRYLPDLSADEPEYLNSYGVDLTLKRTDYIVIDDRKFDNQVTAGSKKAEDANDYIDDIPPLNKEHIPDLALKLTSHVLSTSNSDADRLKVLRDLVQDFPKYSSKIAQSGDDYASILGAVNENLKVPVPDGLYINGVPVPEKKLNPLKIMSVLKRELGLQDLLSRLMGSAANAANLSEELSGRLNEFTGSVVRYDVSSIEGAIVYLNNIEKDPQYEHYSTSRDSYGDLQPGVFPPVKENVHDLVFAINLSDPAQLYYFLQTVTAILNRSVPQRVGVLPLIQSEADEIIANQFLYACNVYGLRNGISFLINLNEEVFSKGLETISLSDLYLLDIPENYDFDALLSHNRRFQNRFKIDSPHILVNGVFYSLLNPRWQYMINSQVSYDINLLHSAYLEGSIPDGMSLRAYLLSGSRSHRNTFIAPDQGNAENFEFLTYTSEGAREEILRAVQDDKIHSFEKLIENIPSDTLWFIGSLKNPQVAAQLRNIADWFESSASDNVRALIVNTDLEKASPSGKISDLLHGISSGDVHLDREVVQLVESTLGLEVQAESAFILFAGRLIDLKSKLLDVNDLSLLKEFEEEHRLAFIRDISAGIPSVTSSADVFEHFVMLLTQTYYYKQTDYISGGLPPRYKISDLNTKTSLRVGSDESSIQVTIVLDPITEYSQKLLAISTMFQEMPFVSLKVILRPHSDLEDIPIKRFFRGVYDYRLVFDKETGAIDESSKRALFESVPDKTLFTLDIDAPPSWIVMIKEANADLDNVKLELSGPVSGLYELKNILIEGHSFETGSEDSPSMGMVVDLRQNGELYSDTNIMANLGYFQLKANPGLWEFSIKDGTPSSDLYSLLEVTKEYSANVKALTPKRVENLAILDLSGLVVYVKVSKKPGKENESLISLDQPEGTTGGSLINKGFGFLKGAFDRTQKTKQADINIFTVASGHLYERFLGIMTASVRRHTGHTVKFWLIENYMSPLLKKSLPILAEEYDFQYELITYKWPIWLRSQREKQRTIWGYKILFLDVLFPQDLDKVIFVDSDQIVRTDLKELVDLDLEGAAYGYTPMCDSRTEMEGFRFWKQGYWKNLLGENLKYHISALYVIDLKKFRELAAGDRLRQHYQTLSADPNSLSNLDQDLPNNLQHIIKIHSLPQEWLWCETWCNDESLKKAKTIDLCNNPLTKEPKLDRARRQIPEWTEYDDAITNLLNQRLFGKDEQSENTHDEL
ncbi:unnamed protein product [Kuraishia capsulata CBS 1993]|uniref:Glycosyltransferase family 24 protein n=1 Tax=Kuraishia capsulata CBS 1993 TaxID=1382522 RepID=W6MMU6_9ASCO|nr:uncharacterized protein KUCA_T00003491001 [Kuraishia capsulata CBS 1993]CDK27513.1 unnamed protein product [Kuraishia capsulata CBS 1993]